MKLEVHDKIILIFFSPIMLFVDCFRHALFTLLPSEIRKLLAYMHYSWSAARNSDGLTFSDMLGVKIMIKLLGFIYHQLCHKHY